MPEELKDMERPKFTLPVRWILWVIVLGVFFLSFLAFTSPVSEGMGQAAPTATTAPADQTGDPTTPALTPTVDPEEMPPTPEEIGYTDGIIIWSTILMVILLLGTLQQTLRREGR